MKNFIVIMAVMVAVVYTASLSSHNFLLKQIHDEACKVCRNMTEVKLEEWVTKASGLKNRCWHEFFCLAEKSLNATKLHELAKLEILIHQFNRNHSVSCTLKENNSYHLRSLLDDIKNCTKYFKECHCMHTKRKS